MSNPPSLYYRNRHKLNQWLQQLHNTTNQSNKQLSTISSQVTALYIYNILKNHQKQQPVASNIKQQIQQFSCLNLAQQQPISIQQLWQRNQHFMQCLKDYSQDLIYYIYGSDSGRTSLPKCLIGYYELVKNIVNVKNNRQKQTSIQIRNQQIIMKTTKRPKQVNKNNQPISKQLIPPQSQQISFPLQLQNYSTQKILRLILTQSPFSYIRSNLNKLQQSSILTKTFYSQIKLLILKRFQYLCKLFLLKSKNSNNKAHSINSYNYLSYQFNEKINQYFFSQLMQNGDSNSQQQISISIDGIILCIIYSVYRTNRYLILFGDIVSTYERQCQCKIDRQKLLMFYNTQFLIKLFPSYIIGNMQILQNKSKQSKQKQDRDSDYNKQQQALFNQHKRKDKNIKIEGNTKLNINMRNKNICNQIKDQNQNNRMIDESGNNKNLNISNNNLQGNKNIKGSGFRYEHVKQQKSIFDMFQ